MEARLGLTQDNFTGANITSSHTMEMLLGLTQDNFTGANITSSHTMEARLGLTQDNFTGANITGASVVYVRKSKCASGDFFWTLTYKKISTEVEGILS